MGPFGIAAVGLLANKGSGSRHKQNKATDAKGSSRYSNGLLQLEGHRVADGLTDAASIGVCDQTPSSSVTERSIGTLLKPSSNPSQWEGSDSFVRFAVLPTAKKNEVSKTRIDPVLKKESLKNGGNPIVLGLNHIKTRAPSDSVRTVDSALDTSESRSSISVELLGEVSPNSIRRELKQEPGRNEHTPIKLRRSGRIRTDVADHLLLNVQKLSTDGATKGNERSHHGDTSNYVPTAENVTYSPKSSQQKMQEQLSFVNNSIQSSNSIHCSVLSGKSESTTSKGLAADMTGSETTLSGTSVETIEMYDKKETDSPRFKALLRLTCGLSTKKTSVDITSFSHELSSTVSTSNPYWRFQNLKSSEAIVDALQARFCSAKEQVNSELAIFGADLIDIMEAEEGKQDKDCQAKQEDLLVLARDCSVMSVLEFREQCEGIVQKLKEERQLLPLGRLKQLHTRLLFILTTCTRLLQYHKENGAPKDGMIQYKSGVLGSVSRSSVSNVGLAKKFYSQEQRVIGWTNKNFTAFQTLGTESVQTMLEKKAEIKVDVKISKPPLAEKTNSIDSSSNIKSSCAAAALLPPKIEESMNDKNCQKTELLQEIERLKCEGLIKSEEPLKPSRQKRESEDVQHVICRICEDKVPTFCLEAHSHICALAVQCDVKGVSVDNRLSKLALILDKLIECRAPNNGPLLQGNSPDKFKSCAFNQAVSSDGLKRFDKAERNDDDLLDDSEAGAEVLSFQSLFLSKTENSRASSSVGSITPKSPLINKSYFDVNLDDRVSLGESEDPLQIGELADIARCVASTNDSEAGALEYLASCSKDLQNLLLQSKDRALTIYTFGKRIEKLLRGKYMELCEALNASRATKRAAGENTFIQESPSQILRPVPAHSPYKDRTSIDDFEIIKPISRGAFGRVFLARKRTTGDLFAIKVLRKADMIRKNAVESILAERDILISTRNPFVVRFFYSFTCSENLYLVMEYLIGGDLYSLLRNVGCLDETVSQIYIAELVLALEYLHSLGVVHRDLKPDNLLIAHDGHLKLTDFGLSKVGLINSTDDLSRPCSTGSLLPNGDIGTLQIGSKQSQLRAKRQKHSAVGTPDYLAPEILLGTGHGNSADWWSAGIILFECLTGVPPFNAEHPQRIFENILNRKIPWPRVPEDMSADANDLIDKLLTEDPNTRLGANGAAEVKRHPFFKNINWDTLARQKAAFIPNPESPHDTSYFTSRHYWNGADRLPMSLAESAQALSDEEEKREKVDEQFDQPGDLVDFSSSPSSRFSFSNFSFKNLSQLASINYDLLMQSTKLEPTPYIQ